jgi:hypothetical protein
MAEACVAITKVAGLEVAALLARRLASKAEFGCCLLAGGIDAVHLTCLGSTYVNQ